MRKHRLHNDCDVMSGYEHLIIFNRYFELIEAMSIAKCHMRPIGVAIKFAEPGMMFCNITCFVNKYYRNKGIGSRLVNMIIDDDFVIKNPQFPHNFPKATQSGT